MDHLEDDDEERRAGRVSLRRQQQEALTSSFRDPQDRQTQTELMELVRMEIELYGQGINPHMPDSDQHLKHATRQLGSAVQQQPGGWAFFIEPIITIGARWLRKLTRATDRANIVAEMARLAQPLRECLRARLCWIRREIKTPGAADHMVALYRWAGLLTEDGHWTTELPFGQVAPIRVECLMRAYRSLGFDGVMMALEMRRAQSKDPKQTHEQRVAAGVAFHEMCSEGEQTRLSSGSNRLWDRKMVEKMAFLTGQDVREGVGRADAENVHMTDIDIEEENVLPTEERSPSHASDPHPLLLGVSDAALRASESFRQVSMDQTSRE